jgi:serine/threonine-protein kinase
LVRRGGADEDVLPSTSSKELEIELDVSRQKANPLDDHVELTVPEGVARRSRVPDVASKNVDAGGGGMPLGDPTTEKADVVPARESQSRARRTDDPGAAYEKDLHADQASRSKGPVTAHLSTSEGAPAPPASVAGRTPFESTSGDQAESIERSSIPSGDGVREMRTSGTKPPCGDNARKGTRVGLLGVQYDSLVAAALEASASPPRIVGRYVLYGEIASGGMASVHFGRLVGPAGFARPVAIKRLHAQFARDPDFVKMFLDEARLAARIAHPNVVPTLDVVSVDDEVFLVMEYVRGVTLAQLARTLRHQAERIQPLIALGVVSGMLQGLHAAHEAKNDMGERLDLVHRDVSPQNALVGTDGITRLLDFGVAKAAGRLQTTRDGQLKGKLAYMAPEQVRGEPLTRRTDIYAASVVLWEVLTGKRLFYANNEANVLAKVLSAEVPAPSSIVHKLPPSLDRIVLKGLERDPAKRYATAREMAAELDARVGIASPTEIGDWVERTAGEELHARAMRIAQIERAAAESSGSLPAASSPSIADSLPPARQQRPSDGPTYVWGQKTKAEGRGQAEASGFSSPSSGLAVLRAPRSPKVIFAVAASAVALAIVACTLLFLQTTAKRSAQTPEPSSHAAAPSLPSAPAAATAVAEPAPTVPTLNVEDLASASATASATPTPLPPAQAARQVRPAGAPVAGPPPGGPRSGSASGSNADCNPPYTADSKGHIHFKPNCI